MTSTQLNLDVLFVLLGVWWVDLSILDSEEGVVEVSWKLLWFIKGSLHVLIELLCEGVTVVYPEDPLEEVDVDCNVQISPGVVVSEFSNDFGNFLSFEEDSLGQAWILYLFLSDVDGLVWKVIVDENCTNSIVLQFALYDMFLEVSVEPKYFSIIFQPWGLYSGDVVVLWCFSGLLEGEVGEGLGHLVDEILVDLFFNVLFFFLLWSVDEVELLSFVIVLFIGVIEDMTGQKGDLFGKVGLHEVIFLLL